MKKWGFILLILVGLLAVIVNFWLVTKFESKIEILINSQKGGNFSQSVESVKISLITSSMTLIKPILFLSDSEQFLAEEAEIDFSNFAFVRLFWKIYTNQQLLFESVRVTAENPVYKTFDWSFPVASSVSFSANGPLFEIAEIISKNQVPNQSFRIAFQMNNVNGWKSNQSTGGRFQPIPFVEKASLTVQFQAGATPFFDILLSGVSAGNTDGFVRSQIYYSLNGLINAPKLIQINSRIGGKLPIEVPLPGLNDSWFSAGNIMLDVDGSYENNTIQKLNVHLESDDFVWQPPSVWPPNLSLLYFVYGSEPKEVSLESTRIQLNYTSDQFQLEKCFADGDVLRLEAKINTEKNKRDHQFRFISPSYADIRFKTPESLQLAQIFAGMSGLSKGNSIQKRTVVELKGLLNKPDLRISAGR